MQGTRLGPYEIVEQLGAGGMGEVWLAQDTRLGRKVAIKVLPEQFASDPERLARFEQEARAAAALNHPHIAAVYDVGHEGSTHFMVQEYLEGQPLRDLLDRGPLSMKRALAIGTEIAEALKAAHRAGVVHRDLKPENLFVSPDGHAKILDFGLAKLTEMATGPLNSQSMSPTVLGTQAGAIMGTAGYMAPEQVQGEEVDARADVFALGCVLWEMVTGQRAFAGKSVPHTLHKILDEQPEGHDSDAGRALPLRLRWLLERALAKDPEQRAQTAGDVAAELRQIAAEVESGTAVTTSTAAAAPPADGEAAASSSPWKVAVPIALATLLVGAAASWLLRPAAPEPIVGRFEIRYPPDTRRGLGVSRGVTVSPDGRWVVFEANRMLWLRAIGDFEATPIRGTEGSPRNPTFSPDSQNLAFWSDRQLKRVPVGGGAPVTLGDFPANAVGMDWADDGQIYVAQGSGGILSVAENGGTPTVVVEADEGEDLINPQLLPGGEWMLIGVGESNANRWAVAVSLRSGERRPLVRADDALYVTTGHLLFAVDGDLLAQPFGAETLELHGGPVVVVEGVNGSGTGGLNLGVSDRGDLVYRPGRGRGDIVLLTWVGRNGELAPLPFPEAAYDWPKVSPDGRRIAVQVAEESGIDIWIYEIDRGGAQRLTTTGTNRHPVWSADGQWVYYASGEGEDIWRRRADSSSPAERVLEMDGTQTPESISADGGLLSFESGQDIYLLDLDGEAEPRVGVATEAREVNSRLSPDGRFIVHQSDESGESRIYVREIATNRQWPISSGEGFFPNWTPDGGEILYRRRGGQILSVKVTLDPAFSAAPEASLTALPSANRGNFTLDADGSRILFFTAPGETVEGASMERLMVVLNWFEELQQRVPVER